MFEGHVRHYQPGLVSQGSRKRLLVRHRVVGTGGAGRPKPRTKAVRVRKGQKDKLGQKPECLG